MKKLLVSVLCVTSLAVQAEPIAHANNQGGGKIVLTNQVCYMNGKTYEGLYNAYNYVEGGRSMDGCYVLDGETVVVIWEDNTKYRYPVSNFTLIKKNKGGRQI